MKKIWLNSYPDHVKSELSNPEFNSISEIFNHASEKFSDLVAFNNLGTNLSFRRTALLAEKFSAYLFNVLKIKKGDKVAIMLPNLLTFPISFFGSINIGATVVNVNPLFKSREVKILLTDSNVETIVILDKFLNELESVLEETKIKNVIVCRPFDLLNIPMNLIVRTLLFFKTKSHKINSNYILFSDIVRCKEKNPSVSLSGNDVALLQYTGGTTGKSKAAILTHSNLVSNIAQLQLWVDNILSEGRETIITALPMYHIFSLTVNLLFFYKIGSKNILITNPRDLKSFVKTLSRNKFTVITAVNTLFNLLLTSTKFKNSNLQSLKFSVGGGMAVLNSTAKKWKEVTGCEITQGYGLTETSPIVTVNPVGLDFNGSIGLPMPSTEISIRDESDNEVSVGESGELCIKGPQVMGKYWNRDTETKDSFSSDGFFKTGDIAKIDEHGYLYIVDRKKDMIISSGFNVYPNEIEDYVSGFQGVTECGVIGKPDINRGESIILFVVRDSKKISETDILEYCRKGLTVYKQPKKVVFISEIPKNNVGKILRRKLREIG
tara:strand:+ start:1751 stop:3400 length:1650 start_codon:yes stop_codon:yes gene_type:complete